MVKRGGVCAAQPVETVGRSLSTYGRPRLRLGQARLRQLYQFPLEAAAGAGVWTV